MIAAVLGFFQALPQLLKMISGFMGWLNKISGGDPVGHLLKISDVFKQLEEAKSNADYSKSAKELSKLVRGFDH